MQRISAVSPHNREVNCTSTAAYLYRAISFQPRGLIEKRLLAEIVAIADKTHCVPLLHFCS
jgi:hypothetical protein